MSEGSLLFVPLGGAGEIGLNLNMYACDDDWLLVDFGIGFTDDTFPGADIMTPDPRFAEAERANIKGLVITHAHEDHCGALPYLWQRVGCPVWCTPFTAAVVRRKLNEAGLLRSVPLHVVDAGEAFDVGPFNCRFIGVTHSIPQAHSLAIRTPYGNVLHTGDWKLDPEPLVGPRTNTEAFAAFGEEGVLAMVGDSTNVFNPGGSGSEAAVRESLRKLIAHQSNRVALTTFASNIARLESAMLIGAELGREVVVVGRSMHRMIEAAREVGLMPDAPPTISDRFADEIPRDKVLYLCTGCQGEPRAAMARIASGNHPNVRLEPGDTVIFSSKIIPGNERTLYGLHNLMVRNGLEVITEHDHFVHVSGHPNRDEVEQMYRWLRPRIAIPVHGEARHLHEHAALAKRMGVEQALVLANGQMVRLAPGPAEIVDEVPTGRLVLENAALVHEGDDVFRERRRLMAHGTVLVGLVLDAYGSLVLDPQLSVLGAADLDGEPRLRDAVIEAIADAVDNLDDDQVDDDERVREAVRVAVRRGLKLNRDRRPIIEVQISRLTAETISTLSEEAGAA